jgi:hypothetical protein
VFNATFNNISVILVEKTGGPGENYRPVSVPIITDVVGWNLDKGEMNTIM